MWGSIDDVGMLQKDESTKAHLRSIGFNPMPARRCLQMLFASKTPDHEVIVFI